MQGSPSYSHSRGEVNHGRKGEKGGKKVKPLENNVLIEAILDDRSAGGVLLPDVTKEQGQTRKGKVLAV